jgi:polysaccharide biosynthesis transport protein
VNFEEECEMERGMSADQVLASLWRRKTLILAIVAGVFAVGAGIVATLPNVYQSTVVVRVDAHRMGEEMVQRTVSELVEQRITTVRQEMLSRPVLQRAIEDLGLYSDLVKKKGIEVAVERMRKDLDVKVEGENAFEITYRSNDALTAQKVTARLPQIYADEAVKTRTGQAKRATALFTTEVEALKKATSDWERKIAQFKVDHIGELPEQMEMNMRALERIGAMLQTKSEELRVAETRRSDIARSQLAADSEAGRLKAAENAVTRELVAAKTQWTEDHPELQRLQRESGELAAKRKEAEGRMFAEKQERTRSVQLVSAVQKEIVELQQQAQQYQKRLDSTPQWAHELGVLNRDYEITKTKYQSVISRKVEAELAEELEAKAAPSMFNVVSPATLPVEPAKPDRVGGLALAFLMALGLGVLTAVVLEMRDESIRDVKEMKDRIPLPVLAVVPQLGGKGERRILASAREQPPAATMN